MSFPFQSMFRRSLKFVCVFLAIASLSTIANAGVILSLGPMQHDDINDKVSADVFLNFQTDVVGQSFEFFNLDVIHSTVGTSAGSSVFTEYSRISLQRVGDFQNWEVFLSPADPDITEFIIQAPIDLSVGVLQSYFIGAAGSVQFGTLTFNYKSLVAGNPGDFITLNAVGVDPGTPNATSAVIVSGIPGLTPVDFAPGERTFTFGGTPNPAIPEPTSMLCYLTLASVALVRRRRS